MNNAANPFLAFLIHGCFWMAYVSAAGASPEASPQGGVADRGAFDEFWKAGVEVSRFKVRECIDGGVHEGHTELVFSVENFLPTRQVTHEFGDLWSVPVLKLSARGHTRLGLVDRRWSVTVFSPLEPVIEVPKKPNPLIDPALFPYPFKVTASLDTWNEQLFATFNRINNRYRVRSFTPFQMEGDRDETPGDGILEDGLWSIIRINPERLPVGKLLVIPGAVFTFQKRLFPLVALEAQATLTHGEERSSYLLVYPKIGRSLTILFSSQFPHRILAWRIVNAGEPHATEALLTHRKTGLQMDEITEPEAAALRPNLGLE